MEIIDPTARRRKRERWVLVGLGVLLAAVVVVVILATRPPPQIGSDEKVFNEVDALFTAVTARDEKLVNQCEARLKTYQAEGRLPKDAAMFLFDVIARTRAGKWENAAERLYAFMKEQRREGVGGNSSLPISSSQSKRTK